MGVGIYGVHFVLTIHEVFKFQLSISINLKISAEYSNFPCLN